MTERQSWVLDLGTTVFEGGVRFRVWAPAASSVSLVIVNDEKTLPMKSEERDYHSISVPGLRPGTRYRYLLGGGRLRPDPVSRFQPEGVHGPSEVIDPLDFKWEDRNWKGIPLDELILYEIHTGTFTGEGTFEAIIPFLDYLSRELGITAIELMPVGQFPGRRNWGYDGTYLYAPQDSYGGPIGLKRLINACHRKGIAVILDVVYNHLGPEGNYLGDYGPYVTDRYKTPWGPAINFDGPESDEVRKFIIENALYWVTEYHMDGLRVDAVHGIFDFSPRHILYELREALRLQEKRLGRAIVVMAESDLNDTRVLSPASKGGYGLDAQWNDDFHHSLHTLLTGERSGYYQDFGSFHQLAQALREGFVYHGQYSPYRRRCHGSSSKHLPPSKFVVFSQNHDQVGNRRKGDRLSRLVSFEALKLAAGIVLLSPNIPLLFMGEEYGEEAPFEYFTSHSDPELIEAVKKGRRKASAFLRPDKADEEIPDPQDQTAFSRSKIRLDLRKDGKQKILLELYKTLIRLRKETPSLSVPEKKAMQIQLFEEDKVVLIRRKGGKGQTLCVFNFNDEPVKVEAAIERGFWKRIFASPCEAWGGSGTLMPEFIRSTGPEVIFAVDEYAFAIYKRRKEISGLRKGKERK